MSETVETTPREDLTAALTVLTQLAQDHVQSPMAAARMEFFLQAIEADLDYAINPQQLIAYSPGA